MGGTRSANRSSVGPLVGDMRQQLDCVKWNESNPIGSLVGNARDGGDTEDAKPPKWRYRLSEGG